MAKHINSPNDIDDQLIMDIEGIFNDTDPNHPEIPISEDERLVKEGRLRTKQRIFDWLKSITEGKILVPKDQLEIAVTKTKELTLLRADLENDIGWISKAIDNVINSPNPLKLVPKILMGKVKMKELGLDDERLESISAKYAPKAHAEIQAKKQK